MNLITIEVSVVLAVKNESKYILEALNSILSQENIEFEVIVVDDNSSDNTMSIIQKRLNLDSRLSLFRSPGRGKVAAFNYGVSKSKGNFICLFAGDDIMPAESLSKRFKILSQYSKDKALAGLSKIKIMSDDNKKNGLIVPKRKGQGSLSGQSPLMNRKTIELLFPIPDNLPNEDTWLEIALGHTNMIEISNSDIICCNWRMHEGNSMNMLVPYQEYKEKLVLRRAAYELFLKEYRNELNEIEETNLVEMVKGIKCYKNEDIIGLLATKTSLMWKIRILSTINPFFYKLRTAFYNILTGW